MAETTITVTVPRAVLLTANQRLHWAKRAGATTRLRLLAAVAWTAAGAPRFDAARCHVAIDYPDRRRRDVHNLMPTVKALIDGMTHAGLIPDDDDRHLSGPYLDPSGDVTGDGTHRFHLTLTPKETP